MFEGLEVKDPREAAQRYKQMLEKEKAKFLEKINRHDKEHALIVERKAMRIEELESELAQARANLQTGVSRDQYEKEWQANKANVKRWEQVFKQREEQWTSDHIKVVSDLGEHAYSYLLTHKQRQYSEESKNYQLQCKQLKKERRRIEIENLKVTNMVPTMQAKIQTLDREAKRIRSDLTHKTKEAENWKNEANDLNSQLQAAEARHGDEMQSLRDILKSVEDERDALKTSLKEEEVMRIAAEGHIALPIASADEKDEFSSPVRSPRKQRNMQREDDDKENVAPKKTMGELKQLQQELAAEKRLRERAEDQIDFMKMECQFQCCSCRIAENKGKTFVHDNTYLAEMQRIKTSVPLFTPPASAHGDDTMEVVKPEPSDAERPFTPPVEHLPVMMAVDTSSDETSGDGVVARETDAVLTFSPSTGTFRAVPSPVKAHVSAHVSTPAKPSNLGLSAVTETSSEAPLWPSNVHITKAPTSADGEVVTVRRRSTLKENKTAVISIHEDAIKDEDESEAESETMSERPTEPTTPARYELHTTTTTIPIAFSPATPAFRPGRGPMTPSTVAYAASDARTPVLGELSLNLPIDREAALEQIRQRRGRTRSMAEGHATPMKKMVEGVKDRRDISAPVLRTRR
jgi:hypothetical protein